MSRVFITQEKIKKNAFGEFGPQFDLRPLTEFGTPIILLPATLNFFAPVPVVRALREKLSDFCDDDYLVPIGDPSIMVAATAIASHFNNGRVRLLKWDRARHMYWPVQLDISGKEL